MRCLYTCKMHLKRYKRWYKTEDFMKRSLIFIFSGVCVFSFVFFACTPKNLSGESKKIVQTMTLDQKIGQLLMVGVDSTVLTPYSRAMIKKIQPGGIIFFGYNISTAAGIFSLTNALQKCSLDSGSLPLFISLDQEGGRVIRITDGVTQFPGNMALGVANDAETLESAARVLGMELRKLGINMNLAPDLDVNNNPANPVINTRSFGADPLLVAKLGTAYIHGLQKARCIAVGKHFPGHGDTNTDSHLAIPRIDYPIEHLRKTEFVPFVKAIEGGVEGIMTAHIAYPAVLGDNMPATLSPYFLTNILRDSMKFKGFVITDDLEMAGASGSISIGECAVRSFAAGTDILLISTHGKSTEQMFNALKKAVADGRITEERINQSVERIIELKLRYGIVQYNKETQKISMPELVASPEEQALLARAGEINRTITRASLYLYQPPGSVVLAAADAECDRVLISPSGYMRNAVSSATGQSWKIFGSEADFVNYIETRSKKADSPMYVYYQLYTPVDWWIKKLSALSKTCGFSLCIIATGNPYTMFPFIKNNSVLYTYSITPESLYQAGLCITGLFAPQTEMPSSMRILYKP